MRARHLAVYTALLWSVTMSGSTHAEQTGKDSSEWAACHSRFSAHMDLIATTKAIDCGFFSLTQPQSRFLEIKSCARAVAKTDKPFKFGYADYGDDSLYCHAAIRDPSGRLWSYFYDSDISGGSGGPDALEISICQTLTFEQGTIGEHSFFHLENCEPNETFNAVLRN